MTAYDGTRFFPPAPIATVTLEGDGGQLVGVELMIDSGADLTLLPRTAATAIGQMSRSTHELEGFDGKRSTAEAVKLTVVFLNKRFRGEFLVIDQEVGFLGRDLLSKCVITLDGPSNEWRQEAAR